MEVDIKEQLETHLEYIKELESVSLQGKSEMEEFLKFLTKKIQVEKSKTAQLNQLYTHETKCLDKSPFSKIIESMRRKCKNECEQYQKFVENLVNDVAYPFKDGMNEFEAKSKELFLNVKMSIVGLGHSIDNFQKER